MQFITYKRNCLTPSTFWFQNFYVIYITNVKPINTQVVHRSYIRHSLEKQTTKVTGFFYIFKQARSPWPRNVQILFLVPMSMKAKTLSFPDLWLNCVSHLECQSTYPYKIKVLFRNYSPNLFRYFNYIQRIKTVATEPNVASVETITLLIHKRKRFRSFRLQYFSLSRI